MDNYTEQILDKKPSVKQRMALVGAIAVIAAGCVTLISISGSIGLSVIILGIVLVYFAKSAQSMEYEYLLINGDCEISKIINKSSRKKAYSFSAGDVQRILPYNSEKFQNELEVNSGLSIKDFTSGVKEGRDNWYAFITNTKSAAVILELNEKSLEHVRTYYKNKFEE